MTESISERQLLMRVSMLAGDRAVSANRLSGGDLSEVYSVQFESGRRMVAKHGESVSAEAEMLQVMAAAGVRVPEVIGAGKQLLVMMWVDGRGRLGGNAWDNLASQLALLHGAVAGDYGWTAGHNFGAVPIFNTQWPDWPTFWARNRLLCHHGYVPSAVMARIEKLCARLGDILPERPAASLLHGDLWGGNVMVSAGGETCLIDPACYYGDREVDVAMLTVFNQPPETFFQALDLPHGWAERLPVYRLWPWLVHVRLFGEGYLPSLESELTRLGV